MIEWLAASNNLKVSVTYWWKIWTFGKFWQKSYLSLKSKNIKFILVNLSDKLTKSELYKIFLINLLSSNFTSVRWCCWSSLSLLLFVSLFSVSGSPSFKNHIFQETPFSGCFHIFAYAIWKTIPRNLNYVQCLNITPMEKVWFMVPKEYSPNRKGIMAPIEYTLMVYSSNGISMFLWKIVFRSW